MKFRALLACLLSAGCLGLIWSLHAAEAGAVQFANPDLKLGPVGADQDVRVTFLLTNHSDKAVKIVDVDPSCRCTSVQKFPDEIPAHGSGAIELLFNSSRAAAGEVTKSVEVTLSNGQDLVAQFHATVALPAPATTPLPVPTNPPANKN